jgi:acyl carrier protein
MTSLSLDRFLKVAAQAARDRQQFWVAENIEAQGAAYGIFENRDLDSFGTVQFVMALEERLQWDPGFKVGFQVPDQELDDIQDLGQLFRLVCNLADVRPDYAPALQLA